MADKSDIEWTDATWNPIVGCSPPSPGCTNCYAMSFAGNRLDGNLKTPHYAGTTTKSKAGPVWTGKLALAPKHILMAPLRWAKPRMIFVNSMGDLFHEDVPDEWIDRIHAVMSLCSQHDFQVLTKRAKRMRAYFDDPEHRAMAIGAAFGNMLDGDWIWDEGKQYRAQIEGMISLAHGMASDDQGFAREDFLPLPNVWFGISAEDQRRLDERRDDLRATLASVRFLSIEPLLGPMALDLSGLSQVYRPIHWVIVGGESGPNARPMHPAWARSLRDQCATAGVPFFFKQWGVWAPGASSDEEVVRLGKTRAGRLLDGREHNDMRERVNG